MTLVRNIKKASAIAEEWLDDKVYLPSGKSWEDLYEHVISKSSEISNEKSNYTGWIAFEILEKFNDVGVNYISALTPGEDGKDGSGRADFWKKVR